MSQAEAKMLPGGEMWAVDCAWYTVGVNFIYNADRLKQVN